MNIQRAAKSLTFAALLIILMIFCAEGTQTMHAYAVESLSGGVYNASTFPSPKKDIQFTGDATIIMDADLKLGTIEAGHNELTIAGSGTLTLGGYSCLISTDYLTIDGSEIIADQQNGTFDGYAIDARDKARINNAKITLDDYGESGACFFSYSNIIIQNSELNITGNSSGIVSDAVSIENSTLKVDAGSGPAIETFNGRIEFVDSNLMLSSNMDGIISKYDLIIDSSEIEIEVPKDSFAMLAEESVIKLSDDIYVKSPKGTKLEPYGVYNCALLDSISNPANKVVIAKKRVSDAACTASSIAAKSYTGKPLKPAVSLKFNGKEMLDGSDYTISYADNTNAGTAKVIITGVGNYSGKKTLTFKIKKVANPLKIKGKTATVKYSKLKKSSQTLAATKVIKFTKKLKDKKTYKKLSGNKKITINKSTGKVTVKKGLKKGTYKVKVQVKGKGDKNHKASDWKKTTFTIKVS